MATEAWRYRLVRLKWVADVGWQLALEDGTTVDGLEAILNAFDAAGWGLVDRHEDISSVRPQGGTRHVLQLVFKRPA